MLIIVLPVATGLSAILGHGIQAIAIAVIVLFTPVLSFIQNRPRENAIERLRHLASPETTLCRNSKVIAIPERDLVRGEIILIQADDHVPKDARLLEAQNLKMEESALGGESVPMLELTKLWLKQRNA